LEELPEIKEWLISQYKTKKTIIFSKKKRKKNNKDIYSNN